MTDQPQGEQLINCPFCDEDPSAEGHYQTGKLLLQRPNGMAVQHTLTCNFALPEDRPELFWSYTFNLMERLVVGAHESMPSDSVRLPWFKLAPEDEEWAREMERRLRKGL